MSCLPQPGAPHAHRHPAPLGDRRACLRPGTAACRTGLADRRGVLHLALDAGGTTAALYKLLFTVPETFELGRIGSEAMAFGLVLRLPRPAWYTQGDGQRRYCDGRQSLQRYNLDFLLHDPAVGPGVVTMTALQTGETPMRTVNKIVLVGHLGQDPELRAPKNNGRPWCTFSLATGRPRRTDDGWAEDTDWHGVKCFGATAERVSRFLSKGSLAAVEGQVVYEKWTDGRSHHGEDPRRPGRSVGGR